MKVDFKKVVKIKEFSKDLKILYVEDNEEARDATQDVLEEFFENITVAVDGQDGLDKFRANEFDLIITDINMPKLDGISMLKEIRKENTDIAVLVISAYNESGYFMETIRLNVEGYILKPLEINQFITMISKVVEKIKLRYENKQYQKELEQKVKDQVEQLRHKDKVLIEREKFASLGEMIDAIAHQFRQPLGIMRLRNDEIEYIIKEDLKLLNDDLEESILSNHAQINHLLGTIEEFRRFFRTDTSIENINLKELFNSVSVLLKDELIKRTTQIEINCLDDIYIKAISNEFKHVIINLINNAMDAFEEKGIDSRIIKIDAYKKDDKVYIDIIDNAGGIPEDTIDKIFEVNFTTKDIEHGTGIGLYISKTILEKIDANIYASNIENGAKFTITTLIGD
jgi:signal transduction histidine kinase